MTLHFRWLLGAAGLVAGANAVARVQRHGQQLRESPAVNAARKTVGSDGTVSTDVLIVGSGAAALTAALRAHSLGLQALIVEKHDKIGGTSCFSGSGCWVPMATVASDKPDDLGKVILADGTPGRDSETLAYQYMSAVVGDVGPASSEARRRAYLKYSPHMVQFLEQEHGFRWLRTPYYPDYRQDKPGATRAGRGLEAGLFDAAVLGPAWFGMLHRDPAHPQGAPVFSHELGALQRAGCSTDGLWMAIKVFGGRLLPQLAVGGHPVALGVSLVSQLVYRNVQAGTPMWTSTPMKSLVVDEHTGKVTGAVVERHGQEMTVKAQNVLLATGGFARNDAMRKQFQGVSCPQITADWSCAAQTDQGDGIRAAQAVGAAVALMDAAWWGAALHDPRTGLNEFCMYDRALPHTLVVDSRGERFLDEAQDYASYGNALWEHQRQLQKTKSGSAVPAYLIMDSHHRRRYVFANRIPAWLPIPKADLDAGFLVKADSLDDLAHTLGIDATGLAKTVERFNGFVDTGIDRDFGRGGNAYDQCLGDPAYTKNPNLGRLDKGPFYAARLYPGDLGTKGGILTDEKGRALREVSSRFGTSTTHAVIPGLYAVGNVSASVMGRTYPGAGSTLGPALTFAYIAVGDMAGRE